MRNKFPYYTEINPPSIKTCLLFLIKGRLIYMYILNAKKPAPGKDIKIVEKNGNVKV